MKLRDFEYSISISRFVLFASDPVIVEASLSHPDGERFKFCFYLHEAPGKNKLFWSDEYSEAIYDNDLVKIDQLRETYARIYILRIAEIL